MPLCNKNSALLDSAIIRGTTTTVSSYNTKLRKYVRFAVTCRDIQCNTSLLCPLKSLNIFTLTPVTGTLKKQFENDFEMLFEVDVLVRNRYSRRH